MGMSSEREDVRDGGAGRERIEDREELRKGRVWRGKHWAKKKVGELTERKVDQGKSLTGKELG